MTVPRPSPAVVITGASTGIGRACALDLGARGFQVFAGVRRSEDGERLSAGGQNITPLLIDVTEQASIDDAARTVAATVADRGLHGLVNNAGIAVSGPIEFIPLVELRRQLEVNLVGHIAVTQALLPLLRAARGRIVNIGSIGGRVALPFLGPYAASKFAMEGLSDSMRRELAPHGVRVSLVEPGAIATDIWERGNTAANSLLEQMPAEGMALYGDEMRRARASADARASEAIPAAEVAAVVAHALTSSRPRTRYLVGRMAKIMAALARVLPDRALDGLIARQA